MSKLDLISSCSVKMSSSLSMVVHELSPWDLPLLLIDPIQKGILFHKPDEKNFVDHLKTSLSCTLDSFPPLAGRLGTTINNEDDTMCFFVDCNNAGVEFSHAIARGVSVSDVLDPTYVPEIISSFFPLNGIPNYQGNSKPLFAVQVTELVDGIFIGCSANHAVIDVTSFWHFINSWSEISRGFDTISKPPVLERWFPENVKPPIPIPFPNPIPVPLTHDLEQNGSVPPPLMERAFQFSKESIVKLKNKANSEAGTDKISSLQALSAHLWRSMLRCRNKGIHNPNNCNTQDQVCFLMPVSTRARIPLPDGYLGNTIYCSTIETSEQQILQHGLGWTAFKLNELVAQQTREQAIRLVEDWVKNPMMARKRSNIFFISSSPRDNVYGNDFGWGKPIAVRSGMGYKTDGKMTLYPAAEPGGIDVQVCSALHTLEAMGHDAEFMEAVTI